MAKLFNDDILTYENQFVTVGFDGWSIFGNLAAIQDDYIVINVGELKNPVHIDIKKESISFITAVSKEDYETVRRILEGLPVEELQAP